MLYSKLNHGDLSFVPIYLAVGLFALIVVKLSRDRSSNADTSTAVHTNRKKDVVS